MKKIIIALLILTLLIGCSKDLTALEQSETKQLQVSYETLDLKKHFPEEDDLYFYVYLKDNDKIIFTVSYSNDPNYKQEIYALNLNNDSLELISDIKSNQTLTPVLYEKGVLYLVSEEYENTNSKLVLLQYQDQELTPLIEKKAYLTRYINLSYINHELTLVIENTDELQQRTLGIYNIKNDEETEIEYPDEDIIFTNVEDNNIYFETVDGYYKYANQKVSEYKNERQYSSYEVGEMIVEGNKIPMYQDDSITISYNKQSVTHKNSHIVSMLNDTFVITNSGNDSFTLEFLSLESDYLPTAHNDLTVSYINDDKLVSQKLLDEKDSEVFESLSFGFSDSNTLYYFDTQGLIFMLEVDLI